MCHCQNFKIKFIIYENNLVIGANKYLWVLQKIFVSYKDLEGISDKNKKIIVIGNIIREEILNFDFNNDTKSKFDTINILVLEKSRSKNFC